MKTRKVQTTRFGEIEVKRAELITMPLVGQDERTWFIHEDDVGHPFKWLQSVNTPSEAYVVVEPSTLFPNYHFSVKKSSLSYIEAEDIEQLEVLLLVVLGPNPLDVTVNQAGPIIINQANNRGVQLVLSDEAFSVAHPMFATVVDAESVAEANAKSLNSSNF